MRLCLLAFVMMAAFVGGGFAQERPNIIVIIADDMGWKDIGYNGSEIQTPHLDKLAVKGVRLERFYAQSSCSPTRASLLTGQSALRTGVRSAILQTSDASLPLNLKTLPEYLREAGYTTALIGKWHLGHQRKKMLPLARGFDTAYGFLNGGIGHVDHVSAGSYDWHRNEVTWREEGHATNLIGDEAVRLIKTRDKNKPLFLYIAFSAPHLPNEAAAETIKKYAHIKNKHRRIHAAMVDDMDTEIGRIVATLTDEGINETTLIWFLSDNGGTNEHLNRGGFGALARWVEGNLSNPAPTRLLEFIRMNTLDGGSDNGPYRGGKGSVYEGGVLVPSLVYYPSHYQPRKLEQRITVQDIMPTFLSLAGVLTNVAQPVDGRDVQAFLQGQKSITKNIAIADYIAVSRSSLAYYMDNWKLHYDAEEQYKLYDLHADPYEKNDIAAQQPELVKQMTQKIDAFPRGDVVNISPFWIFLDSEGWGGKEDGNPWIERLKKN